MAKKLQAQKRSEYNNPPKACPRPADLRRFPEIYAFVIREWRMRLENARSGANSRRRAAAKAACRAPARQGKYAKRKGS